MKLAIVDDNKLEQELIFNTLRTYEHERNISLDISSYSDGNSFLNTYVPGDFDLIFMDIYLNELNGIDIVRKIRQMDSKVMIVFLTTSKEYIFEAAPFHFFDYILKPFSLKELDARITAHLKREQRHSQNTEFRFHGELCIDYGQKNVQINEEIIEFTKLEYEIIELLSTHPGQVFDKERIYEITCGYDAEGDSRVITELIRRIRKKIGNYSDTEYIETVWGMGYKWKK